MDPEIGHSLASERMNARSLGALIPACVSAVLSSTFVSHENVRVRMGKAYNPREIVRNDKTIHLFSAVLA